MNKLRHDARLIIQAGLKALDSKDIIDALFTSEVKNPNTSEVFLKFNLDKFDNIYLVGSGKGSSAIAKEVEKKLPKISEGLVIDIKDFKTSHLNKNLLFEPVENINQKFSFSIESKNKSLQDKKIKLVIGTHPLPSEKNIKATRKIEKICEKAGKNDLVLAIICGGTSALLVDPVNSLEKTRQIYDKLLKSGASIREINTVRRHIDKVKNGGLAKMAKPAKIISLYISDVPDHNFATFGSGPTYPDKTTVFDAKKILKKYHLDGDIKFAPEYQYNAKNDQNIIIAKNNLALETMAKTARKLGYKPIIGRDNYKENIDFVAGDLLKNSKPNTALIAAGEAKINVVKNHGVGGRNTHLAALVLKNLKPNMVFASIASDGIDNSPAAGAIVGPWTIEKLTSEVKSSDSDTSQVSFYINKYLKNFDSYNLFKKTGDLIIIGPMPINVADIYLVLRK